MNQEEIKSELVAHCEVYFNSIESLFEYRKKHIGTYNIIGKIYLFTTAIFAFTVIPFLPFLFKDELLRYLGPRLIIHSYIIPIDNFFIRWLFLLLLVFPVFVIFHFVRLYLKSKSKKYSIPPNQLSFAYIAKTVKELKLFLINDRTELTTDAVKSLERYNKMSGAYLNLKSNAGEIPEKHFLPDVIKELQEQRFWIEFDKKTLAVTKALVDFDSKIIKRVDQKKEIDQVIDWLSSLLIYEYSKIKKPKEDDKYTNEKLDELGQIFFFDFCECVNIAQVLKVQTSDIDANNSKNLFGKFIANSFETTCNLFTHKLIIVSFICWLFFLSSIFIVFIYSGIKIFNLRVDNTLFITGLSGIILGTITITATVYSKKKI